MAQINGNGNGRIFKIFMAFGTIFVSAGIGFIIWSFEARVEQVVEKKLQYYVEVERYERDQILHDKWSQEKLESIDDRFRRLEIAGQERLDILIGLSASIKTVASDVKELRKTANRP